MNIAIISGSIREGRQSHKVARIMFQRLIKEDIQVEMLDLKGYKFPLMEKPYLEITDARESFEKFGKKLSQAHGLIIVSPEYNGSYPGVLKNALDYFKPEFNHKPIGVVTVSSGDFGGIMAAQQLQNYILGIKAYPNPHTLQVPNVDTNATETGEFSNPRTKELMKTFVKEFLGFVNVLAPTQKQLLSI